MDPVPNFTSTVLAVDRAIAVITGVWHMAVTRPLIISVIQVASSPSHPSVIKCGIAAALSGIQQRSSDRGKYSWSPVTD